MSATVTTTLRPTYTTGIIGMYGGTKDGKKPWIDFKNNTANINTPKEIPIRVDDMRFMKPQPSFQTHGYGFLTHSSLCTPDQLLHGKDSDEHKKIVDDVYMAEVVELIKKHTGGAEVVANGFRLRTQFQDGTDVVKSKVAYGSVNTVHVDRDPENAHWRLATSIGQGRADELLAKYKGKKWASVNIWRPIGNSVHKWPLCFVNHDNVPDWNYLPHMVHVATLSDPAVLERGDKGHETVLLNDERYSYAYASHLSEDECLIFASFHSDPKKVVPHGAFWDDNTKSDAPTRSSIEARCWVFWDEDQE